MGPVAFSGVVKTTVTTIMAPKRSITMTTADKNAISCGPFDPTPMEGIDENQLPF